MSAAAFEIEDNILKGFKISIPKQQKSLGHKIFEHMGKNCDLTAVINTNNEEKYSFGELKDLSIRCALWLIRQGVKHNDIVTICSHNHMNTTIPFHATFFVGAIFNPWFHEMNEKTTEYFMNFIKPKVIFCTKSCVDAISKAATTVGVKTKIVTFEKTPDYEWFEDIIKGEKPEDVQNFKCIEIENLDQTGLILFSSGTTGLPKGVELSHKSLSNYASLSEANSGFTVCLWYSSMYWISATLCVLMQVFTPMTALVHQNFDIHETCRVVEKYKVSWLLLSTSMFHQLFKAKTISEYDMKCLKFLVTGGSKTSSEALEYFTRALPGTFVCQVYGMTEGGGALTTPHKYNVEKKEAIGTVAKNVDMKFVNQNTGECLGPNKVGELCYKALSLMNGYYKNPEATKNTIDEEGWLHSGDLGYFDDDGFIYLVDRMKEILKVQGHHVAPLEIEQCLAKHPGVLEVAVVAVPHITDIDHPIAFVSRRFEFPSEELMNLAASLGEFKKLRAGVKFLDKFPYTASGKIDRKRLREIAKEMCG